jgi:DNA-binding NtrC family response regulator
VSGPREALSLARTDMVDAAVIALTMPTDAGMKLARQLRHEFPELPVVLITRSRSFETVVEAMRIGVFDYLLKPFTMSELIDTVDRAARWRREALHARRHPADLHRQVTERTIRLSAAFAMYAGTSAAELQSLFASVSRRSPESLAHARRWRRRSVSTNRRLPPSSRRHSCTIWARLRFQMS